MENDKPWNDHPPFYYLNPFYHSTADTSGTLNFSLLKLVTQTALASIANLASPGSMSTIDVTDQASAHGQDQFNAFPNPFNIETSIHFSLTHSSHLNVTIYNSTGQKVIRLYDNFLTAGSHVLRWNGEKAASGLYFCVLLTNQEYRVLKLALLK